MKLKQDELTPILEVLEQEWPSSVALAHALYTAIYDHAIAKRQSKMALMFVGSHMAAYGPFYNVATAKGCANRYVKAAGRGAYFKIGTLQPAAVLLELANG